MIYFIFLAAVVLFLVFYWAMLKRELRTSKEDFVMVFPAYPIPTKAYYDRLDQLRPPSPVREMKIQKWRQAGRDQAAKRIQEAQREASA